MPFVVSDVSEEYPAFLTAQPSNENVNYDNESHPVLEASFSV